MTHLKKLKILHVVPSYLPAYRYGGPIQSVHGICRSLSERGHDVHVFTTNINGTGTLDVPLGTPVGLDGVNVWYFPVLYRRLCWAPSMTSVLKRNMPGYDLVHLHSIFLWPTWAAARSSRQAGVPYIISPRGMFVRNLVRKKSRIVKTAWISVIERHNLEKASAIHATSTREAVEAKKFAFKLPEIAIIPNGIEIDDADLKEDSLPERIHGDYILFVGRVSWEKGLDRLIKALAYFPSLALVIAGNDDTGYRVALQTVAEKCGVASRIRFIGPVYGSAKFELMRHALFLVLPSYSESFGNVVLEAMTVGCPVVVTSDVGAADIVRASGAGLVVDGTPQELGRAMSGLVSDPVARSRMGELGRLSVQENYRWETVAKTMEQLYARILEG